MICRFTGFLILVLTLAACSGDGPPPQGGPRVLAGLGPDGTAVVALVEALPPGAAIREVWLSGPSGDRLSGVPLEERRRGDGGGDGLALPGIGVGATGGSSSGVRPSFSLHWGPVKRGPSGHWRDSRWLIPVPASVRPGLFETGWRVELHYLDSDGIARVMRRPVRL